MALMLGDFDVMAYLWDTMEKTPDGRHIRYTADDIAALWYMGFADTARVTLQQWQSLFESYRQPDGTFLLDHDSFLALDAHRYKGEIHLPFDAMQINEGRYTDQGLNDLVRDSIAPSTCLPPDQLNAFITKLAQEHRDAQGLIDIRKPAKEKIKKLIDENPSPLRNLELVFDQMMEGFFQQSETGVAPPGTQREAARQLSRFVAQPVSRAERDSLKLKAITQAKSHAAPETKTGAPDVTLKSLKRHPRRGMKT